MATLLGNCFCDQTLYPSSRGSRKRENSQFVELHGLRYIGLGAVTDELSAKERVYDTLEQLTVETDRLVNIGRTVGKDELEFIPLQLFQQQLDPGISMLLKLLSQKDYETALEVIAEWLKLHQSDEGDPRLAGITAHNYAVVLALSGQHEEAKDFFLGSIHLKEEVLGKEHMQVAKSLDELAIQHFVLGNYPEAVQVLQRAHEIRRQHNTDISITLNNLGCCFFQRKDRTQALETLRQARIFLQSNPIMKSDIDILHKAIVMCNIGYLLLCEKQYDDARSILEEALLIQQSVLPSSHRALRDTTSNLDFANAFHS